MTTDPDLFPGFETRTIETHGLSQFVRIGGDGPPLLCLHGYPQTHAAFHRIAQPLAEHFTVVLPDLRGYGATSAPAPSRGHESYSKRAMAADARAVMQSLGHNRFHVMGHDRGGRVAYRLALDTPDVVDKLVCLDILPTVEVWDAMRAAAAQRSYHWSFLAQPSPLPEMLIAGAPRAYIEMTLKSWVRDGDLSQLDPAALDAYCRQFDRPETITAVCEDYRAGATYDAAIDAQDRAAGNRIKAPTLIVWGSDYLGRGGANPLAVWETWCDHVRGHAIPSGHFLAEENPDALLAHVIPFLTDGA